MLFLGFFVHWIFLLHWIFISFFLLNGPFDEPNFFDIHQYRHNLLKFEGNPILFIWKPNIINLILPMDMETMDTVKFFFHGHGNSMLSLCLLNLDTALANKQLLFAVQHYSCQLVPYNSFFIGLEVHSLRHHLAYQVKPMKVIEYLSSS